MLNPLISIITPCYNASAYLKETITSVLNQTYQNWEMLVIDDCSSDNSCDIIKYYAAMDGRIRYFKTESQTGSPSLPRNIGIENSKGEYIAFLDADDLWLPTKLEHQLNYISKTQSSFVYSYCSYFRSLDKIGKKGWLPSKTVYKSFILWDCISLSTAILRKSAIDDYRFENCPQEDYVFFLKILKTGIAALNTNETVALYRIVENSRSNNKLKMLYHHYLILRNERLSPLHSFLGTTTHAICAYLRRLLIPF